jgi:hypothetical protein
MYSEEVGIVIEVLFDDPVERLLVFQVVTKSLEDATTFTFVHALQLSPSFDSVIRPVLLVNVCDVVVDALPPVVRAAIAVGDLSSILDISGLAIFGL